MVHRMHGAFYYKSVFKINPVGVFASTRIIPCRHTASIPDPYEILLTALAGAYRL